MRAAWASVWTLSMYNDECRWLCALGGRHTMFAVIKTVYCLVFFHAPSLPPFLPPSLPPFLPPSLPLSLLPEKMLAFSNRHATNSHCCYCILQVAPLLDSFIFAKCCGGWTSTYLYYVCYVHVFRTLCELMQRPLRSLQSKVFVLIFLMLIPDETN